MPLFRRKDSRTPAKRRELNNRDDDLDLGNGDDPKATGLTSDHVEDREEDITILADEDGSKEQKLQLQAAKEVQSAASDSLRKLHVLQLGRCPSCGERIRRHLFASVCEACGWSSYEVPRSGSVKVHLKNSGDAIEGDVCYMVKNGMLLVLKGDLVIARVGRNAYEVVEYLWTESEKKQLQRQLANRMSIGCGWCGGKTDPNEDGFHLVHLALGTTQERYCFCCDDCYEAFRKMYPARVHRNCYERDCTNCELCEKRYAGGTEGMHALAKDFLAIKILGMKK